MSAKRSDVGRALTAVQRRVIAEGRFLPASTLERVLKAWLQAQPAPPASPRPAPAPCTGRRDGHDWRGDPTQPARCRACRVRLCWRLSRKGTRCRLARALCRYHR